jgi:sugar lactone lactonase YvrE
MKLRCAVLAFCLFALIVGEASGQTSLVPSRKGTISTYARFEPPFQNGALATTQSIDLYDGAIAPAMDGKGGFYIADAYQHCVFRVQADGHIYLAAGNPQASGDSGDGGPATAALLNYPDGLAADTQGNVFISDGSSGRIRKITPSGVITTFASFLSYPRALALDSGNNLYVVEYNRYRVSKYSPAGQATVVAGNGQSGFSGDGGSATSASIGFTDGIAVDSSGNLFLSDITNHRVRKVTSAGTITTIAGTGTNGFSGDGGPATQAQLSQPMGLAVDPTGNLYMADYQDHAIRKVSTSGMITTLAGGPSGGGTIFGGTFGGFGGDGGPASAASLRGPVSVAYNSSGSLYFSDAGNYRVREITPDGLIQTDAGNGTGTGFWGFNPRSLAGDASGNLYVTGLSRVVYRIDPSGKQTIFAGNGTFGFGGDGFPAVQAAFAGPGDLATDKAGNVYISDTSNFRIRKVNASGIVTTIAGNGQNGFSGDGGPATAASMSFPGALAVDDSGAVYFSDGYNARIRKIAPDGKITTIAGNGATVFSGDGIATEVSVTASTLLIDSSGTIFFGDGTNQRIRKITPDGRVITIAGTGSVGFNGDHQALATSFFTPSYMVLDKANNLYFSDTNNERIRKLSPEGFITTIAGGQFGYAGDGGPAASSQLYAPLGLVLDPSGTLFVADAFNGVIRSIALQESAEFSLSPSLSGTVKTSGTSSQVTTGFASITPYAGSSGLSGMAILSYRCDSALASEATIPASPAIRNGRIRAEVSGNARTGLALANPNSDPATVDFFFTNANGDFGFSELTIPPNGHLAAFLNEPPFNGGSVDGTFTFRSSVPVAATALRSIINERGDFLMTTLPVVDLDVSRGAAPSLIPQFAAGGGWTTQVLLVNPTDSAIGGSMRFTSPSGDAVTMNLDGQQNVDFNYSIPPRGAQTFTTAAAGQTLTGSITVVPSNGSAAPNAMAIYSFSANGVTVTTTGVPAIPISNSFGMYVETAGDFADREAGSLQTGIAIANPTDSPITVNLSLSSNSILVQPVGSVTVPAHGQIAAFLNEISGFDASAVRGARLPYRGVLSAKSSALFSMIGIRGRYNERGDFLASTTLPVSESPLPPATVLIIPHFADSGGFSTQFVVFNANGGQAAPGFITFFGDAGRDPVF